MSNHEVGSHVIVLAEDITPTGIFRTLPSFAGELQSEERFVLGVSGPASTWTVTLQGTFSAPYSDNPDPAWVDIVTINESSPSPVIHFTSVPYFRAKISNVTGGSLSVHVYVGPR